MLYEPIPERLTEHLFFLVRFYTRFNSFSLSFYLMIGSNPLNFFFAAQHHGHARMYAAGFYF